MVSTNHAKVYIFLEIEKTHSNCPKTILLARKRTHSECWQVLEFFSCHSIAKHHVLRFFQFSYSFQRKKWLLYFDCLHKMDFSKHGVWLWVARKTFLEFASTHYVYLQASLWSYIPFEVNGSIIRCFNPILWFQTWADGDFLLFIPLLKEKVVTLFWLPSKNGF